MCTTCRNKRKKGRGSVNGFDMGEFFGDVPAHFISTGAKVGGFVAAKAINGPIKKIGFVREGLEGENGKWWSGGISTAKVLGSIAINRTWGDGGLITDFCIGAGLEGGVELLGLAMPKFNMLGSVTDDFEHLGTTIDIDLDELSGPGDHATDQLLENSEVASADHVLDDQLEDAMLADDELEYLELY